MTKAREVMEEFAQRVIKSIEDGLVEGKWVKPWHGSTFFLPPVNALTNKVYQGGNFMLFAAMGETLGFHSGYWATYKQWTELGAQVQKGSKGTTGIKWVVNECKHAPDEQCERCGRMFPVAFTVFNEQQIEGWSSGTIVDEPQPMNPDERSPELDDFFDNTGAVVQYGLGSASYIPTSDVIRMPKFEDFFDARYFYSTLSHEMVHWTSHSSRVNREVVPYYQDQDKYAFEELIAELGATMLCAHLRIEEQPRDDHAQYLAHWVGHLKNDHKMLWKACSLASKAVEYVMALQPSNQEELVAA